jgi:hypothetical protein
VKLLLRVPANCHFIDRRSYFTLERIRQIEAKALRKLKHRSRTRKLRSFLDQWGRNLAFTVRQVAQA